MDDLFGPVTAPLYSVRFNNEAEVRAAVCYSGACTPSKRKAFDQHAVKSAHAPFREQVFEAYNT